MIKVLSYLFIFTLIMAFFYGFLIAREYIRYFIRKLKLKHDKKLRKFYD